MVIVFGAAYLYWRKNKEEDEEYVNQKKAKKYGLFDNLKNPFDRSSKRRDPFGDGDGDTFDRYA